MPIVQNTSALNLNSDMSVQAPVVSTDTSNLGPNKWIVAGVAATVALAVNVTDQIKGDRFDLVSNIATGTAAVVGAGISYKLASDLPSEIPTSMAAVLGGSIGALSAVIVEPIAYMAGNKVVGSFFTKEESEDQVSIAMEQPVLVTGKDGSQYLFDTQEEADKANV